MKYDFLFVGCPTLHPVSIPFPDNLLSTYYTNALILPLLIKIRDSHRFIISLRLFLLLYQIFEWDAKNVRELSVLSLSQAAALYF